MSVGNPRQMGGQMDLRDYDQGKFTIADILRSVAKVTPSESRDLQERLRDLFARLAEDRFNLIVVGRFSRGKTSLMNALMGTDRLPMGIVPLTSVITTVSYGTKEQAILNYAGRVLSKEVPIEELPRYITQQGNPGNVQRIRTADVQLRAEVLRRGFYFVDTPGLGSAIVENSRTTESFLPEGDAFLVVTSYESPLSEEEMRFFRAVSPSGRRVFVVLNKQDLLSPGERDDALVFVRGQLNALFGQRAPQIFSVSAREGLAAKCSHDETRLAASGIPVLEERLVKFLLTEKSANFLLAMCHRVRELVQSLPRSSETITATERIGALSQRIAQDNGAVPATRHLGAAPEFPTLQQLKPCEICEHINEALWQFLCKFQ